MSDSTKLSHSTTVARYKKLVAENDRPAVSKFIVERFNERYFDPLENSSKKHGFATLALTCLVIETLESFYQGLIDTKGRSLEMFQDFLKRDTPLKVLGGDKDWFYKDIRCGILHQGESRGGWRVIRKGQLLDIEEHTLNATAILANLKSTVKSYALQIQTDEKLWGNFCAKMNAVCANCNCG